MNKRNLKTEHKERSRNTPQKKFLKSKTHTPRLLALMNGISQGLVPCGVLHFDFFLFGAKNTLQPQGLLCTHTTSLYPFPQQSLTTVGQHFSVIHTLRCLGILFWD